MNGPWEAGTVPLQDMHPGADRTVWRRVGGVVRGPWGIVQEDADGRWWNLTHRPTGCSAGWFTQRRYAEAFAAALDRLPIDWPAVTLENFADVVLPRLKTIDRLRKRPSYRPPPAAPIGYEYVRRLSGMRR